MSLRCKGTESITVDATVGGVALTTIPYDTVMALISVEVAPIRYNCKNPPTAAGSEGSILLEPGDDLEVWGAPDLQSFRAIRTTGTSATIRVQYFGGG